MVAMEAFKRTLLDHSKKISDCANLLLNQEAGRHGLTAMQLRLLLELDQEGAMTVGEVAAQLGQAGTNVSTMCKKLEGAGLVSRQRSAADERIVMVVLTAEGKDQMAEINAVIEKKINRMIESVDENELNEMLSGLKKFSLLLSRAALGEEDLGGDESQVNAKERD